MKKLIFFFLTLFSSTVFGQSVYYISNAGSDGNDGRSISTSWKTLKVVSPGNTYLLKRGDTFYFTINKVSNATNNKIIIGAYGEGQKPIISLYKSIVKNAWQQNGGNIWKVDLKNTSNYTGYLYNVDTNVGFINVDGKIKGNKVGGTASLQSPWDFYSDSQYLYVYSSENPGTLGANIQITTNNNIISLSNNMEISNISLQGCGAHGISGSSASNILIKNVDIKNIGGSYLIGYAKGSTRFGNGIQFWGNTSNCLVEGCDVENVYDVAFTIQCTVPNTHFDNIVFTNNIAKNNEQSFEFWVKDSSSTITNCKFINNYCTNAGLGWSHSVRPDKNVGVHVLCYFLNDGPNDLTISNNTFIGAKSGYIHLPGNARNVKMFKSDNNKISLPPSVPVEAGDFNTLNNGAKKLGNNFNLEKNSTFKATN